MSDKGYDNPNLRIPRDDRFYLYPSKLVDEKGKLIFTKRQFEVLDLFINGDKTKVIADKLNISIKTVEKHLFGQITKPKMVIESKKPRIGVYGVLEKKFGRRPQNVADLMVNFLLKGGLGGPIPPEGIETQDNMSNNT